MANKFRFTNEKCPVCNSVFTEDDDIVVCPECGTPHHRECYKEHKKCANHEKHTENFRWEPDFVYPDPEESQKKETDKQTVPNVEPLPVFSLQLNNLPNLLDRAYDDFDDNIKAEDMALFVRQDAKKYISKFQKTKEKKATWNWGAFFFTPYWFFYRKMYKLGAIFLAITLLISVGFSLSPSVQKLNADITKWTEKYNIENSDDFTEDEILQANEERQAFMRENPTGVKLLFAQVTLLLALKVTVGLTANKWYYNYTLKNVKKINEQEKDVQKHKLLLLQSGGTSVGGFFMAVLANNIIIMAIEMLLTYIK